MKIYLAGKIAKNDWRHSIVDGLRGSYQPDDTFNREEWPELPGAIFGAHDYTGPFFVGCDHGGFHGENTHGIGATLDDHGGHHPAMCCDSAPLSREHIFAQCVKAIGDSDAVYCWLERPDAYGSLVEVGVAIAQRKPTCVAYAPLDDGDDPPWLADLWFVTTGASVSFAASDASEGLKSFLTHTSVRGTILAARCKSPIERQFVLAAAQVLPQTIGKLDVQVPVECGSRTFHLDVALVTPTAKIAVELDGHAFHERTKEQAQHDKSRDRLLAAAGWTVLRFTGSEVFADAHRCAREVLQIAIARRTP